MSRYEDYSFLEQILTFGELYDKITGPNHWKRNKFNGHMLQKCAVWNKALEDHTHLVQQCFCSILEQSNPSKTKNYLVWTSEKRLSNFMFLVSTNASWFHSYLRKPSGNFLSTPIDRKIPFAIPVLLQNFQEMFSFFILRILAIVIGSCCPV